MSTLTQQPASPDSHDIPESPEAPEPTDPSEISDSMDYDSSSMGSSETERQYHCAMCQQDLQDRPKHEQDVPKLINFIKTKCEPTPYMYHWLITYPFEPFLCDPCINWRRRCLVGLLSRPHKQQARPKTQPVKRFAKPMLQVDQLITYLMQPGRCQLPDKRCLHRLLFALRDPTNLMPHIMPLCIQTIIGFTEGNTELDLVRAWWKYNNQTHFLRHPLTAKRVRAVIKLDLNRKLALESGAILEQEEYSESEASEEEEED